MSIVVNAKHDKITQGAWVEFGGSKFLVCHSSNLKFQRTFARLQQPHRSKIEKGTLDPAISKEIVCKAFSQALILNWEDVVDSEGADVPFSTESAYEALTNNPDLVEYIQEVSNNLAYYKSEELEALGKN